MSARPVIGIGLTSAIAAAFMLCASSVIAAPQSRLLDDGDLSLAFGERAIIHLSPNGAIVVDSIETIDPDKAMDEPPPDPDHIALALGRLQTGTVMKVGNGYARAMNYHAVMFLRRDGQARHAPTSVCTLLPHIFDMENWPFAIDAVVVSGFADAEPGQTVCQ